jgi:uncharacterized protein (TIGR02246 family)
MNEQINELIDKWAAAELAGDFGAYDELLAPEFRGVGPVGFVLNRDQWGSRHRRGLVNHEFRVEDREIRQFGDDSAVVTAVQTQKTTIGPGQENNGSFRIVVVVVREEGRWVIGHVQFSGPMISVGA